MRSLSDIKRDFGDMRHFNKIDWHLVRELDDDFGDDKTLLRFRRWLASCPEIRGHILVFSHYNTILTLTKNRITNVSNATPYSCIFSSSSLEIVPEETYDVGAQDRDHEPKKKQKKKEKDKERRRKSNMKRRGKLMKRAPRLLILCGFPGWFQFLHNLPNPLSLLSLSLSIYVSLSPSLSIYICISLSISLYLYMYLSLYLSHTHLYSSIFIRKLKKNIIQVPASLHFVGN